MPSCTGSVRVRTYFYWPPSCVTIPSPSSVCYTPTLQRVLFSVLFPSLSHLTPSATRSICGVKQTRSFLLLLLLTGLLPVFSLLLFFRSLCTVIFGLVSGCFHPFNFLRQSLSTFQTSLELMIILPQALKCWNCRHTPSHLFNFQFLDVMCWWLPTWCSCSILNVSKYYAHSSSCLLSLTWSRWFQDKVYSYIVMAKFGSDQGLADFLHQRPDSQYSRFYKLHVFIIAHSCLLFFNIII